MEKERRMVLVENQPRYTGVNAAFSKLIDF